MLLVSMREDIEYHRDYAMLIAAFLSSESDGASEKLKEAWTDYTQVRFPYMGDVRKASLERIKKEFDKMDKGPLVVRPLMG